MSPLELPGRSFGYLPDRRNTTCVYCGRSFRDYVLGKEEKHNATRLVELNCPYCGKRLDFADLSKVIAVDKYGEKIDNRR